MSEDVTLDDFVDDESSSNEDNEERLERRLGPVIVQYPSDWNIQSMESLYSQKSIGTNERGDGEEESRQVPLIKMGDLNRGNLSIDNPETVGNADKLLEENQLKKGDLLFNTRNTPELVGKTAVWDGRYPAVYDNNLLRVRFKLDISSKFVNYFLSSGTGWRQLKSRVQGTTSVAAIYDSEFDKIQIPLPQPDEQYKIATVLHNVDQAIQKTEEIIQQANSVKSGVVQQVFREGAKEHHSYIETKSGKIPEEWEIVRFEEIIEDTRYGTDTKSNTDGDGYPTLRIPNVVEKRITLDDLKYTQLDKDELDRLKLKEGDILVIRTNGNPDYVGRCATFSERDEPFVFASYLIRVRVNESTVQPEYVREFLNSRRGRSEMAGWIRGSAGNYNLSVGAMERFQIPIPPLSEQDEIVEKIDAAERTIEVNRKYRNHLDRLKQGLMQDLLSGTIRTNGTNIEVPEEIEQYG